MIQKKPAFKSNFHILKDIIIEYVISRAVIRTFCIYIAFATFIECLLNVLFVNSSKDLTKSLKSGENLGQTILYWAILYISSNTLAQVNSFIFVSPIQHVFRLTGKNSFKNFINMELTKYNTLGCGEIQTIIDRESKAISELVEVLFANCVNIVFTVILASQSIFYNLGFLSMIIILLSIAFYIVVTIWFVNWRTGIRHDYNTTQQRCSNHLHDSLINHETILAYKTEEEESLKYEKYVSDVETECNRLWRSLSLMESVNKIIFALQGFLVLLFACFEFSSAKLNSQNLVFYLGINKTLFSSFGKLGFFYSRYTQAILNVKTSFKPEFVEERTDLIEKSNFENDIKVVDATFSYADKNILENINLTIKKGEKVAIIGKNGSGKSSLAKMIMRFEDYTGMIYLDNLDIHDIANPSYRNLISYAPQTSFLFNETVNYNVVYGTQIVDSEEVYAVSQKLKVHDSICKLENQYDTEVGDKGQKLSGGERQKVILLRSAIKNSQIIILDEATAALDKKAELEILSNLISENAEKTFIIILHNLELLYLFDKVLNIHDKTVTTHIKNDGKFSTLKL